MSLSLTRPETAPMPSTAMAAEPLSEEPTKAFDASGQLLMIGSRIKIHRDTEPGTEGIVLALYPEGAAQIPYAQVDLDNGKNETLEAAKLEKLDASFAQAQSTTSTNRRFGAISGIHPE